MFLNMGLLGSDNCLLNPRKYPWKPTHKHIQGYSKCGENNTNRFHLRWEHPSPNQPALQKHCFCGKVVAFMSMQEPRLPQSASVKHSSNLM